MTSGFNLGGSQGSWSRDKTQGDTTMKRFMLVSIIMSMLTGCAGMETAPSSDGTVTGNIFQLASVPFIKIKVDPTFHYVGATIDYVHGTESRDRAISLKTGNSHRRDFFVFAQSDPDKVRRSIIVKMIRLDKGWMWPGDIYTNSKTRIDKGRTFLGKYEYEYAIDYVTYKRPDVIVDFLDSKKLIFPKCPVGKRFGREIGENLKYEIFYFEDVSQYGLSCSDFKNLKLLPDKVKNYIPEFNERCAQAFQVID